MLNDEQVADRVETTLKLSNVTGDSAQQVSDYMTSIWNNFYDGSESLESFADKITALGAATASSSAEIANGLQQFAAIGNTVGLSYDYAATALATVVAQTRQSETVVGNAFRTIFSRLQGLKLGETLEDGTDLNKYSKALASVGVSIKDATGNLRSMDDILDDLGTRWQTLSKDQQTALAQTVGGTRQYTQLIALMDHWDKFKENLEITQNSEGSLQKQADIYAESWEAARKRVQAAWQAIYQDLIDDKFFIALNNGWATALKGVDQLIDSMGGLKGVIAGIGAIVTQVFQKQMVQGLQNAQRTIQSWHFNKDEKSTMDWRREGLVDAMMIDLNRADFNTPSDTVEAAAVQGMRDQLNLTYSLRQVYSQLTDDQKEFAVGLTQQVDRLHQSVVEATQLRQTLKQRSKDNLNAIADKVNDTVLKRGKKNKDHGDDFLKALEDYSVSSEGEASQDLESLMSSYNTEGWDDALKQRVQDLAKEGKKYKVTTGECRNYLETQVQLYQVYQKLKAVQENYDNSLDRAKATIKQLRDAKHQGLIADQEIIKILNEEIETNKKNINTWTEQRSKLKEGSKDYEDLTKKIEKATQANKNYQKEVESFGSKKSGANLEKMVGIAQGVNQAMFAISSVTSIIQQIQEIDKAAKEGTDTTQAFVSVLTSVPMAIMGIFSAYETLNTALAGGTLLGLGAGGILAVLAGITAAIYGIAYAIKKAKEASPEGQLKKAKEAADEATKSLQDTKTAFDNLKDSLENYTDARNALKDLKEGTDEWKEAVLKLNEQVLELLNTYPELAQYISSDNGILNISSEGLQSLYQSQLQKVAEAQYNSLIANNNARSASYNNNVAEAAKGMSYSKTIANNNTWQGASGDSNTITTSVTVSPDDLQNVITAYQKDNTILAQSAEEFAKTMDIGQSEAKTLLDNTDKIIELSNQANANAVAAKSTIDTAISNYMDVTSDIGDYFKNAEDKNFVETYLANQVKDQVNEGTTGEEVGKIVGNKLTDYFTDITDTSNNIVESQLDTKVSQAKQDFFNRAAEQTQNAASNIGSTLTFAGKKGGLSADELKDWYNGLSDEDKTLVFNIDFDKVTSKENLDSALDNLQEAARQELANNAESVHELNDLLRDGKIQAEEFNSAFVDLDEAEQSADLDKDEWEDFSHYLQDSAEASEELSNDLKDNKDAADDVAKSIMRMNDGIDELADNWEDWSDILKNSTGSSEEYHEAMSGMKDAVADLLDTNKEFISNDFITEHLDEIGEAATGSEDAIDNLKSALTKDIVARIIVDNELDEAGIANLDNSLKWIQDYLDQNPVKVGAQIDDTSFIDACNKMIASAGMTTEQVQSLFNSMGFKATFAQEPQKVVTKIPEYTTHHEITSLTSQKIGSGDNEVEVPVWEEKSWTEQTGEHEAKGEAAAFAMSTDGSVPKIETLTKKANSGMNNYSSSNKGGGTPGKSSGGKKGGGSKKKETKEHKEQKQEEDRYHNIKEAIDDLTTSLSRLGKTQDRVYGKAKLKYMDQEINKLQKQIDLTDEYIKEIKQYAAVDRAKLEGIGAGAQFDSEGMLTNYEQVLQNLVGTYNAAVATYNGAVDSYNASAQEDADKEALNSAKSALDAAEKKYDANKKILDQYEDTYNLLQEQLDKRIDQVWALFDKRLEQVTYRVDFEIDWNEEDIKYLDWLVKYNDKINDVTDSIAKYAKQMEIANTNVEQAKKGIKDIFALYNTEVDPNNTQGMLDSLTRNMYEQGLPSQMTEESVEKVKDYIQDLMDYYDKQMEAWKNAHEAMMDAWNEWNDKIRDSIDVISDYGSTMEHIEKIIDATGRKLLHLNTGDVARMNQAIIDNANAQVKAEKSLVDDMLPTVERAKQAYEEAVAAGLSDTTQKKLYDEWQQFESDYQDQLNNYYNAWEQVLDAIEKQFENTMENMSKDYDESFGKLGLNWLSDEFDRQKDVRGLYLDDYEKYHELNKSAKALAESLEKTTNDMLRGKMVKLQDEINGKMDTGVKISAAQAEIIARRVALLQAEANLLDAENAKSSVRMTRDNEGNFSYTYTADQDAINDAQEEYADKFYDLLKYERDYMDQIQSEMLQKRQEFIDKLNDLADQYKDDQEGFEAAAEQLRNDYLQYMDYYVGEQDMDMQEMARLRDDDWQDFEYHTNSKLAEQDDFITNFKDTIYGDLADAYNTAEEDAANWEKAMDESCAQATKAVSVYQRNTEKSYEAAGENIDKYGQKSVQNMEKIADQSEETADAVDEMTWRMDDDMQQIQSQVYELDQQWGASMDNMRDAIAQLINSLENLLRNLQEVQNQAVATANAISSIPSGPISTPSNWSSTSSNGGGGTGNGGGASGGNPKSTPNNNGYSIYRDPQGSNKDVWAVVDRKGHYVEISGNYWGLKKKYGLATGGYTGKWGSEGRLAMLHEKELVLNKEDTANMLDMVNTVRDMVSSIGSNSMLDKTILSAASAAGLIGVPNSTLDQNVHIEANFPNVESHTEIETALNNLINSASQYVNRR